MGLDQYAYARKEDEDIEIMTWRKHANLQGWMSDLWHKKGNGSEFNCEDMSLSLDDIESLESVHRSLETASGFFWGQTSEHKVEDTQSFINEAKQYLRDGYDIVYSSWY